jgi:formate dehydrogenase major subunit/formate dehydrogenase alpha subunit
VQAFGSGAMTNSIGEIRNADCIFITGSNTAEAHPVIGYEIVRAAKRGANLIIVDPRHIPLVDHATLFLQPHPGTDIYVFLAMMHVIIREGWLDEDFVKARTEGFDDLAAVVKNYPPERASLISGVAEERIEEAARIYALGERSHGESQHQDSRGHSTILYAMGITQRSNGTDNVMTLANLSMLCGQIGKASTGVNPLRGQANVQGACDLGCLVNVFPGYQRVVDDKARKKLAKAWKVESLPAEVGLTIVEATHAAMAGKIRAMYIMGENPMMSDPNTNHVEQAFRNLDLLVVQDIFPSETAFMAHVLLPAASSLEKDGTFTNSERRVQRIRRVIAPPGKALPDWQITAAIGERVASIMGIKDAAKRWTFLDPASIFDELAGSTPIYAGMAYDRLEGNGLQWPCPDPDHPGTPILHVGKFSRGKGKFNPVDARDPVEQTDEEYPLTLTTGRVLYHYHSGTMTRRSEPLHWREPQSYAEINAEDAAAIGLKDGATVEIHSRRGMVLTTTKITDTVPPGTVFLAFHWREAPANRLTQDHTLDPVAKIPEYKVSAVRLEKAKARRRK